MKYRLILIIFLTTFYSANAQLKVKIGDAISLNLPAGTYYFYDKAEVEKYLENFSITKASAELLIGEKYKKDNLTFNLRPVRFISTDIKTVEDRFIDNAKQDFAEKGAPFESQRLTIGDNSFVIANYTKGDKVEFAFRGNNIKSGHAFYIIMSGPQADKVKMKSIVDDIIKSVVIK